MVESAVISPYRSPHRERGNHQPGSCRLLPYEMSENAHPFDRFLMISPTPRQHPVRLQRARASVCANIGAVLRMLVSFVGEEKFLAGVSNYLKKRLYGNSVTKDLWEGIRSATGLDISKVMDNWVKQVRGHDVASPSNIASQTTPCADGVSCHHCHGEGERNSSPPR